MLKRMIHRPKRVDVIKISEFTTQHNPEPVALPPVYPPKHKEDLNKAASKAKMVVECSDLLRDKYELDIRIWGMQGCEDEDIPERESLQRRSDAMFREIRMIVRQWRSPYSQNKWTEEEWEQIREISSTIEHHRLRRSDR
jgi:hypothetical protein